MCQGVQQRAALVRIAATLEKLICPSCSSPFDLYVKQTAGRGPLSSKYASVVNAVEGTGTLYNGIFELMLVRFYGWRAGARKIVSFELGGQSRLGGRVACHVHSIPLCPWNSRLFKRLSRTC